MIVGYLCNAKFICLRCLRELDFDANSPTPIPVLDYNLSFYSQSCSNCGTLCYKGKVETELFPTPQLSDDRLTLAQVNGYVTQFKQAVKSEDWEAATSIRVYLYLLVLTAIMDDDIEDRDKIFEAVRTVMNVGCPSW